MRTSGLGLSKGFASLGAFPIFGQPRVRKFGIAGERTRTLRTDIRLYPMSEFEYGDTYTISTEGAFTHRWLISEWSRTSSLVRMR